LSSVSNERHFELMLSSLELTGRARTHVRESAQLGATLHPEAAQALTDLKNAARAAGIDLAVRSGYRDLGRQAAIWNAKYRGSRRLLARDGAELDRSRLSERALIDAILAWSALPGASRHHWGSDADVIDAAAMPPDYQPQLIAQEFAEGGIFGRLSAWLAEHAGEFGFFRPYSRDRGGVMPEPWHLSYAPLAVPALATLTLELLAEAVGSSTMDARELVLARLPELYERYVLAIDPPG
jgi:LAS superfamily LD-carboxypeptidase LdcB